MGEARPNPATCWVTGFFDFMPLVVNYKLGPDDALAALQRRDSFNRPDGGLGPNWSLLPDWPSNDADMQIVNGRVRSIPGHTRGDQFYNNFPAPLTDQWGSVKIASWTGTVNRLGAVLLRQASDADTTYEFSLIHDPAFDRAVIAKVIGGAYTELNNATYVASVGDVINAYAIGTSLRHYVNGVLRVSVTNSDIASGYPGLATIVPSGSATNADVELEDWWGGAVVKFPT